MSALRSPFMKEFAARGHLHQCTAEAELDALMAKERVTGYIGFDCTAPSLHIGNLTQIMRLRILQRNGHKPIVVVGGGTTKVGDPSGKDESRQLLTDAAIEANKQRHMEIYRRFLKFGDGSADAIMVDNAEWLDKLGYIPFLRDVGKHFTINRMLTFDSVKLRLEREQPLTFLEFNYMILQAYDFLELNRRFGCRLQMGGSDQWGNIVNGIDLTRRVDAVELYGLTTPLITTADGGKMGKTASGAVWLHEDSLPAYDYWQFWRNTDDRDVGRFLRLFTDLSLDEIARLEALEGAEINEAKKILATEATTWLHGAAAAQAAADTARRTFEQGDSAEGLPSASVPRERLAQGYPLLDAFLAVQLITSKSEGRRHMSANALKVNNEVVSADRALTPADLADGVIKLSVGKKKHALLKVQ